MPYRQLGGSRLRVSVLTMGTMTIGGKGGFAAVGSTGVQEARRQVDRCLDAGVNLIDTANVYWAGSRRSSSARSWKTAARGCPELRGTSVAAPMIVLSQEVGRVVLCRKRIASRASRRARFFGRGAGLARCAHRLPTPSRA